MSENNKSAALTFQSFDGGGPEFTVSIDDEAIAGYKQSREYYDKNHNEQCGSGYTVYIEFFALKKGRTTATVECRSPIAENFDAIYEISVDESLSITVKEINTKQLFR